jgi:hypothetical protein
MGRENSGKQSDSWPKRLRRTALFALFALVLLIPKALGLRRRFRVWNVMRVGVALLGTILVVAPASGASGRWIAVLGLTLFLLALLVPPSKKGKSVDDQARELGALVVVNGGVFRTADGQGVPARLFVAPERVVALDRAHHPLLEIPLGNVKAVRAEESNGGWRLCVQWSDASAEFSYQGIFAEHLARVAETTLRNLLHRELPVLP